MKFLLTSFTLIVFAATGCNNNDPNVFTNKFPVTKEFLTRNEWMIDSVYGDDKFIQDYIYFTPENKFWRCSYYNSSYIIDSSLNFQNDSISTNGITKYKIYTIDSSNILLVDSSSTAFHCKRRNSFNPERIERFVKSNPKKRLLNGNWELENSELIPTTVPSFCDSLYPGTRFNFNPDGIFEVYSKDSTRKCGRYSYSIREDRISFIEYDMVMEFGILKLTSDTLMLKSTFIHDNLWNEEVIKAIQNGYTLVFTKVK